MQRIKPEFKGLKACLNVNCTGLSIHMHDKLFLYNPMTTFLYPMAARRAAYKMENHIVIFEMIHVNVKN